MDRFDNRLNRISDMWYGQFSDDEAEWLLCTELDGDFGPEKMEEICNLLDRLYDNVNKFNISPK